MHTMHLLDVGNHSVCNSLSFGVQHGLTGIGLGKRLRLGGATEVLSNDSDKTVSVQLLFLTQTV